MEGMEESAAPRCSRDGSIRTLILFHSKRHPDSMGVEHVNAFLTELAPGRGGKEGLAERMITDRPNRSSFVQTR
jgi:hypothetical protein